MGGDKMNETKEHYFENKARIILDSAIEKEWLNDGYYSVNYQESKIAIRSISKKLGSNYKKCAILAKNSVDWIHIALSVILNEKTLVPISPFLTNTEIVNGLEKIKCDYLITDDERILSLEKELNCEVVYLKNLMKIDNPDETITIKYRMNEIPLIMFSSGTSESIKCIQLKKRGLNFIFASISEKLNFTEDNRLFLPTPLNFIQSFWSTFCVLLNGGSVYIKRKIKYDTFWQDIHNSNSNICVTVPSIVHRLAKEKIYPQSNLKLDYMIVGGDILNPNIAKDLCSNTSNLKLVNCYGLTETSSVCTILLPTFAQTKLGSVGKPLNDEIKIKLVDNVIHIKTPGLMELDYLKNENNSEWFNTGDLGYFDEDGFLYVTGRDSSLIKKNGIKINPLIIEKEILEFDFVKEVIVQGVQNSILGEEILASIVLNDGINSERAESILMGRLSRRLAKPLLPKIIFVSEILKTSSGKYIRKRGTKY